MGIFSNIFSRNKPDVENSRASDKKSTSQSIYWGNSSAGTTVNENTAMQVAAVYACVRVISEAVASLPLSVYSYKDHTMKLADDHHLQYLVHSAPNNEMTSFDLRETLMSHLLIYGNAYAQIMRDKKGRVIALYPLMPNKMEVRRNESGELYYAYWRDYDEPHKRTESGGVIMRKDHVLHIHGLSFNGLVGFSPIELAKNTIGMAMATEQYGAGFFANGANPGGVLESTKTINDPGKLRQVWNETYKGSQNSGKIAVLEDGVSFKTVSVPPEQAQFLETRKFQINEIARIFRVPPHMIGDLERSSFNNIEHQSLEFVKYCLTPWVVRWEQALDQNLLLISERKTHKIKFNLDGLLRGDYATRMQGYATGIQHGFLSPNDVRKLENWNDIPEMRGGENYMVNGNLVKLEDVGAAYRDRKGLNNNDEE